MSCPSLSYLDTSCWLGMSWWLLVSPCRFRKHDRLHQHLHAWQMAIAAGVPPMEICSEGATLRALQTTASFRCFQFLVVFSCFFLYARGHACFRHLTKRPKAVKRCLLRPFEQPNQSKTNNNISKGSQPHHAPKKKGQRANIHRHHQQ